MKFPCPKREGHFVIAPEFFDHVQDDTGMRRQARLKTLHTSGRLGVECQDHSLCFISPTILLPNVCDAAIGIAAAGGVVSKFRLFIKTWRNHFEWNVIMYSNLDNYFPSWRGAGSFKKIVYFVVKDFLLPFSLIHVMASGINLRLPIVRSWFFAVFHLTNKGPSLPFSKLRFTVSTFANMYIGTYCFRKIIFWHPIRTALSTEHKKY